MKRDMSLQSRQELTSSVRSRYEAANYREKRKILDAYVAVTGYHRKSAIRCLGKTVSRERKKRGVTPTYDAPGKQALERLWQLANQIWAKRLAPFLPDFVPVLEKCGHLTREA